MNSITGVIYILLMVYYFTRLNWAKNYLRNTTTEIIDIHKNHISSIFRYSKVVYSNNNFYFVNQKI